MQCVQRRRWLKITVKLVPPTLLGSLQEARLSPPFAILTDIFNPSFDFSSTPKGCSKHHSCLLVWIETSCCYTVLNSPSLCFITILSTPWHLWVPLLICILMVPPPEIKRQQGLTLLCSLLQADLRICWSISISRCALEQGKTSIFIKLLNESE